MYEALRISQSKMYKYLGFLTSKYDNGELSDKGI